MKTLDEAWEWYQSAGHYLKLVERLGEHYWELLPWASGMEGDDRFRDLNGKTVAREARSCIAHLKDLAVVVLFSVFESQVRQHILAEIKEEAEKLKHRTLRLAATEAQERIDEGSFFHVLQPFKDGYADLVEQVNQVRRYRNWVAHGKREEPAANVTPKDAYDRLKRFLDILIPPTVSEAPL